jgi:hypothetical protein
VSMKQFYINAVLVSTALLLLLCSYCSALIALLCFFLAVMLRGELAAMRIAYGKKAKEVLALGQFASAPLKGV